MKKFDLEDVRFRTSIQKDWLDKCKKYFDDPDKIKRLAEQECVVCYYTSRIAGQAFTNANCKLCDVVMQFHTTATDRLCIACAKEHSLCKHCGADIHYRKRNKIYNPMEAVPPTTESVAVVLDAISFADWRDKYFVKFLGRWEYIDNPERGNWSDDDLYKKFNNQKTVAIDTPKELCYQTVVRKLEDAIKPEYANDTFSWMQIEKAIQNIYSLHYICNADCPDVEYGNCCHPTNCQKKLVQQSEIKTK